MLSSAAREQLPNFGMPPPKKRRPEVPSFGAIGGGKSGGKSGGKGFGKQQDAEPGELSAGERERRIKAGLPESTLKGGGAYQHPLAGALNEEGRPIYDANGKPLWKSGTPAESFAGPLLKPSTDKASAESTPSSSSSSSPKLAGEAKDDAAPLESVDDLWAESKAGESFAGVYGFGTAKHEERSSAKKAIALRLEPLKPGVPDFERVMSEDNQSVVVGSKRGAVDILIIDEAVSKRHCEFGLIGFHHELALSITDHSTNGTFVNGKRVPSKGKRFRIRNGDRVEVKATSLDENFGWTCDFGNTVSFFSR